MFIPSVVGCVWYLHKVWKNPPRRTCCMQTGLWCMHIAYLCMSVYFVYTNYPIRKKTESLNDPSGLIHLRLHIFCALFFAISSFIPVPCHRRRHHRRFVGAVDAVDAIVSTVGVVDVTVTVSLLLSRSYCIAYLQKQAIRVFFTFCTDSYMLFKRVHTYDRCISTISYDLFFYRKWFANASTNRSIWCIKLIVRISELI